MSEVIAPSPRRILKATVIALVVSAVLLFTIVLPAEYGIDPLGTGEALGLTALAATDTAAPPAPEIVPTATTVAPLSAQQIPYKVDAIEFTLQPNRYIEYKYQLSEGATMVYSWTASAPVEVDFHTEPAGKPAEASDSFDKRQAASGRGAYRAPYAGIHGWYWENRNKEPVKVVLQTAGFYRQGRIISDAGTTQTTEVQDPPTP